MDFFTQFELSSINTERGIIRYRKGGKGPPLLMLHGNPQTHLMWHQVAPKLTNEFTLICPDIPGYGKSFKPEISNTHQAYSKVCMAKDIINFMDLLGYKEFNVIAHDRGARVAHRMSLDFPDRINKLILLDIIPTIEHFERINIEFAMGYYHWFWLAQRNPIPESVINKAPEEWFFSHTSREKKDKNFFHPIALNDYLDCIKNPETIKAICEDYRAAATIDLIDDKKSREDNIKIKSPLLILWGNKGKLEEWYNPLSIWKNYCSLELKGNAINSGHYLAEENPEEVIYNIKNFL